MNVDPRAPTVESAVSWPQRLARDHWNPLPLRGKGLIVVAIPLVPLLVIALIFLAMNRVEGRAEVWVTHTHEVKAALHRTLVLVLDAETSVRGFLLTGNRSWLQPYERAVQELPAAASTVSTLVADNPVQVERSARVHALTAARLATLARLVTYVPPDHPPDSLLAEGYRVMDALRVELNAMDADEDLLLADRRAHLDLMRLRTRRLMPFAALLGIVGGLGSIWLFVGGIARRAERVTENAEHLARTEPLIGRPSTSNDELGQMDRALRATATLLDRRVRDLEVAREELDQFFSLSLDMLCIAGVDGRFQRLNPAWHETLGWTTDELSATPYLEFVHEEDQAETVRRAQALASGQTVVSFDNRYRCKDGSYRWLSWKAAAHVNRGRVYAAARDITAQKEAERAQQEHASALAEAQLQAERANRAKTQFLSHMSHDLRTPLNAILGFAQVLERDSLSEDQRDSVAQIIRGGQHLLELISEVIDITRIESGQLSLSLEAISVVDVVHRAVELVKPLAAQRHLTLEVLTIPRDRAVLADRQRVHQILLNYLSNAVKYNRPQGRIAVSLEAARQGRTRIAVTDTGAGLSDEKLALLFQPFERLGAEQSAVEGTGLGLMLCRTLAEAMGGTVGVRSVVDQGCTFWLELAAVHAPADVPLAPEPTAAPTPTRQASSGVVLYIEDNQANTRLMQRILQQRPQVTLLTASHGDSGIAAARDHQPDLVFLDLHLPDMTGEEVLQRLWDDPGTRLIPSVILTADVTPGLTRRLKAAGARAHLTKPLSIARVLEIVDQFLQREYARDIDA